MGALRRLLWAWMAGLALAAPTAQAQAPVPPATSHVIDQTGSLDAAQSGALEARLATFERERGAQVVVLIVPTTAPETIEQFGIRVADQWRLGRQGVDDGVIVLVALKDRTARIEVGYGLEGVLTDAASHRILSETMVPKLRAGDVAGGVSDGVDRILSILVASPATASSATPGRAAPSSGDAGDFPYFWVVVVAVTLGGMLRRAVGPAKTAAITAPVGALLGWAAGGSLVVILSAAALAAILAALGISAWLPWGGRGGDSSFRGRGGGFGGGGASGRW